MNAASGIVGMSEGFLEYGLKYANRKKGIYDASIPVVILIMTMRNIEENITTYKKNME